MLKGRVKLAKNIFFLVVLIMTLFHLKVKYNNKK